jgi:hypothetical protein
MAQEITNQFLTGLLAGPSSLQAAERAQALELSRLTPIQQSTFAGIQAGQEAARGIRGMLGVQTPEEQKMNVRSQARQQAASQAGGDRLKFLETYANALDSAGDAEGAFQARSILDQERMKAAESASKVFQQQAAGTASLAQATRERTPPALEQADRTRLAELIAQFGETEGARKFREERDEAARRTAGAGASKIEVKGQQNILDIDKEDAKDYRSARTSAEKALPTLNRMQTLLNSPEGIIQGTATEARTGFLKALDTFGISTASARKAVSNTEQFNIEVRNLLQSIIKQFGYNPSNADVRFALESLPNASNSPEGLRAVLNSLIKANKDQLNESTRALEYYRKNQGSFSGFQRKPEVFSPGAGTKSLSDMTTEELEAMLAAQKGRR